MPNHIFFIEDCKGADSTVEGSSIMQCIVLPHPKHGKSARYLHTGTDILELQRVAQEPSSWFVGNATLANGSFYVATRVDPLFLALPFLLTSRQKTGENEGKFMEPKQIFMDAAYPQAGCLSTLIPLSQLDLVCDQREGWNSSTLRLSDSKLLTWLTNKVSRLSASLGRSESFQSVVPLGAMGVGVGFQRDAVGLLSEYLSKPLLEMLLVALGLPLDTLVVKRKASSHDVTTADADTSNPQAGSKAKEKGPSVTANKLATINTKGMKSLSAYFGGKPPDKKAKK